MSQIYATTKRPIPTDFIKPMMIELVKYLLFVTSELPSLEGHDRRSRQALAHFETECAVFEESQPQMQYSILMGRTARRPMRHLKVVFTETDNCARAGEVTDYIRLLMRELASIPFTLDRDPLRTFIFSGICDDYNSFQLTQEYVLWVGPLVEADHIVFGPPALLCKFRGFAESEEDLELDE